MSIGLLFFFLFVLVANVAIGYIIAILLGIGPPNFRTALSRIKLSVASPFSQNEGGSSHLSQVKNIVGLMTSFVGRFKKHAQPTSSEYELPSELPVETPTVVPVAESTTTPPVSPAMPSPIPPTLESSGNNPVNAEQPKSTP